MAADSELVDLARKWPDDDLAEIWGSIKNGQGPAGWPEGRAMEHLVLRAFQRERAEIRWPFAVALNGDRRPVEQVDGAVYTSGLSCLVETKDTGDPVGIDPVAKLRFKLLRRPAATIGLLFSRSGITETAAVLVTHSGPQTILTWNGDDLTYAVENKAMVRGLVAKFRYCVERGVPDIDLQLALANDRGE
jgi:hypothetical protein